MALGAITRGVEPLLALFWRSAHFLLRSTTRNDVSYEVSVNPVDEAGIDISQLRPFGAHLGAQKMICSQTTKKAILRPPKNQW
jgi:hypothetical protein